MKLYQVLTTLSFGDAVSNDALAIMDLLNKNGFKVNTYAEHIDTRLTSVDGVKEINQLPKLNDDDIMIYHLSTGTDLNRKIKSMGGRKLLIYHNITPPKFFAKYSGLTARLCSKGRGEVQSLKDTFEGVLCVSDYNREDLLDMGYRCPMAVRPILIPFKDYDKTPDQEIIEKYSDGIKNVVFVSRIAPNKKQEDLISMMSAYKKMYGDSIRLFIVGNPKGLENYDKRLKDYAKLLDLDNVIFTGQVSFPSILAYYRIADAFVCMSEHEGFGVPLIEAMYFKVPILAAANAAVPDTLGGSGILTVNDDPKRSAFLLHELLYDEDIRKEVIEGQNTRLTSFSYEKVSALFMEQLQRFIRGEAV
ncbi:MAG: glycosyltransferase family 4 protein [Clostridiales bacterium]|nr:glycosyltransferase family 4 protein [Clostridiales bacterium]